MPNSVEDQIAEFLRSFHQQQAPPAPPPRPAPAAPRRLEQQEILADLVEPEVVEPEAEVGDRVSSHVTQHMDNSDIQRHSDQLGEEVNLADDKLEAHQRELFGGRVGRISGGRSKMEETKANVITRDAGVVAHFDLEGLVKLLRTPQGLAQAVIVNEVFRRPE